MSDLKSLIPLRDAPAFVPGPPPHISTLRRWYTVGVGGRRLPHYMRGGRVYLNPADVVAFAAFAPSAEVLSCK